VFGFKSDGAYIKNATVEKKLLDGTHTHSSIISHSASIELNHYHYEARFNLPGLVAKFGNKALEKSSSIIYNVGTSPNPFSAGYFNNIVLSNLEFVGDTISVNEIAGNMPSGSLDKMLLNAEAIKNYVDSVAVGLNYYEGGVDTITTSSLGASFNHGRLIANRNEAIPSINGVALSLYDKLIVNHQASQLQNGIYEVTDVGSTTSPWVIQRPTDANSDDELNGIVVRVKEGTMANNTYVQVKFIEDIDIDDIYFDLIFANPGTSIGGSGTSDYLAIWNNSSSIKKETGFYLDLKKPIPSKINSVQW